MGMGHGMTTPGLSPLPAPLSHICLCPCLHPHLYPNPHPCPHPLPAPHTRIPACILTRTPARTPCPHLGEIGVVGAQGQHVAAEGEEEGGLAGAGGDEGSVRRVGEAWWVPVGGQHPHHRLRHRVLVGVVHLRGLEGCGGGVPRSDPLPPGLLHPWVPPGIPPAPAPWVSLSPGHHSPPQASPISPVPPCPPTSPVSPGTPISPHIPHPRHPPSPRVPPTPRASFPSGVPHLPWAPPSPGGTPVSPDTPHPGYPHLTGHLLPQHPPSPQVPPCPPGSLTLGTPTSPPASLTLGTPSPQPPPSPPSPPP